MLFRESCHRAILDLLPIMPVVHTGHLDVYSGTHVLVRVETGIELASRVNVQIDSLRLSDGRRLITITKGV